MNYKEIIKNNFKEVWPNQYLICKNFDKEIIYYADDNEFLYWENLYRKDITDTMKKYLNQGSEIMEDQEILVRTEVYLQKVTAELVKNGADKKVLKNAMKIIEDLMEVEE